MTNDEAKLQAIKNAYKKNWVNLEKYHIKDGWFEMYDLVTESDFIELNENDFDIIGGECRLKQLQGIENNNGWIKIESENETLFIERNNGAGSIVISSQEYNSILETMHLLSSKKNAEHLYKSKEQLEKGEYSIRELIEV